MDQNTSALCALLAVTSAGVRRSVSYLFQIRIFQNSDIAGWLTIECIDSVIL